MTNHPNDETDRRVRLFLHANCGVDVIWAPAFLGLLAWSFSGDHMPSSLFRPVDRRVTTSIILFL